MKQGRYKYPDDVLGQYSCGFYVNHWKICKGWLHRAGEFGITEKSMSRHDMIVGAAIQ